MGPRCRSLSSMGGFPIPFGPYVLLRRLGSGGMGEVLLARQEMGEVRRLVAVKRLHSHFASNKQFLRMFLDELRIVSRLSHPNIGHVLDAGRVGDRIFMTMEYLPGRTLDVLLQVLESRNALVPVDVAVEITRRLASALDHAHTRHNEAGEHLGIIHRDVSPDNVILTVHGEVKLVDFGIAKAKDRLGSTRTGLVKGKVTAMAPEQIHGRPLDQRADIFGLGVLFYRLITGKRPFSSRALGPMLQEILLHRPPAPAQVRADCPVDVSETIDKMIQKFPDDRFPSMSPVLEILDHVLATNGWVVSSRRLAEVLNETFPGEIEVFDEATAHHMLAKVKDLDLRCPDYSIGEVVPVSTDCRTSTGEQGSSSPAPTEMSRHAQGHPDPRTVMALPRSSPADARTVTAGTEPAAPKQQSSTSDEQRARPRALPAVDPPARNPQPPTDEAPTLFGPPDWSEIEKDLGRDGGNAGARPDAPEEMPTVYAPASSLAGEADAKSHRGGPSQDETPGRPGSRRGHDSGRRKVITALEKWLAPLPPMPRQWVLVIVILAVVLLSLLLLTAL